MTSAKKLWIGLLTVIVLSFAVLGYYGREIYREAPPVPKRVITPDGQVIFSGNDIDQGRAVWQTTGGQELGSIWGHGSYTAPDWSADWLHREAVVILNEWAQGAHGTPFDQLDEDQQVLLKSKLARELRANTFDSSSGTLTIDKLRARAIREVSKHYTALFSGDPATAELREAYAMKKVTVDGAERAAQSNAFFFWTAWASVTKRPGD